MKRVYIKEQVCIGCHLCEVYCRLQHAQPKDLTNTPTGNLSRHDDSYLRKVAIRYRVPYITALPATRAAAKGIDAYRRGKSDIKSLQSYHEVIDISARIKK